MRAMALQREWDIEDRDEAREYSRDVYKNLVIDAEEAGFNPLTALRNGGGANYNAAAGFAPLSRKAPVQQAVGGSPLGDAFNGLGDFITNFDPFKDQKREQEYRLVESQISALNASALSGVPRGLGSFASGDFERRPSRGSAVLAKTGTGAGDNGEILNIWTDWKDRNGNIVSLPNPNLPESEQFMVEPLGRTHNALVRPVEKRLNESGWITRRDLTPVEKKAVEESWLPSWVPRFSYRAN